jgi:3-hydroxy-9,10-secoandrosta-1,3,5(10)-triene-9,17-dione monooxygenase
MSLTLPASGADTIDAVELLDGVRKLLPGFAARRSDAEARRDIPASSIAEMRSIGLLRSMQPRRWGGLELDPRLVMDIQNSIAEACPSTAWIYGVLSVQSFLLGRFPEQAQEDVWGADEDAVASSGFQPIGKVTVVEGGYRISGRWPFSSGSTHAKWVLVAGMVPSGEDQKMTLFLVPRSDYEIIDVWQTIGMRATGSNDISIEDAFVPSHRTYAPDSGLMPLRADSGYSDLYRMPWLHLFTSTVSNLGIGAARGALAAFVDVTRTRIGYGGTGRTRENPLVLSAISRTAAMIDRSEVLSRRNLERFMEHVAADTVPTMAEATLYRAQLTGMMRETAEAVDELMLLTGARGIRTDSLITKFWLDVSAARAHFGNDPATAYGLLANELIEGR